MAPNFVVLNTLAAMGICASLAMLGREIDAQRPSVIRYEYSIVLPDPPADSDADSGPSQNDPDQEPHHWRHGDPRDGDNDGRPVGSPETDDAIPI
jgi:hypothetical protein